MSGDKESACESIESPLENSTTGFEDGTEEEESKRFLNVRVVEHWQDHTQPTVKREGSAEPGDYELGGGIESGCRSRGGLLNRLHGWWGRGGSEEVVDGERKDVALYLYIE